MLNAVANLTIKTKNLISNIYLLGKKRNWMECSKQNPLEMHMLFKAFTSCTFLFSSCTSKKPKHTKLPLHSPPNHLEPLCLTSTQPHNITAPHKYHHPTPSSTTLCKEEGIDGAKDRGVKCASILESWICNILFFLSFQNNFSKRLLTCFHNSLSKRILTLFQNNLFERILICFMVSKQPF